MGLFVKIRSENPRSKPAEKIRKKSPVFRRGSDRSAGLLLVGYNGALYAGLSGSPQSGENVPGNIQIPGGRKTALRASYGLTGKRHRKTRPRIAART
jgi:hypothetical protein